MKVKLKKSVPSSSIIDTFISRAVNAPIENLAAVLANFKWIYDKGDFQVWVPLFNHFDDYLEQHVSKRSDLLLEWKDASQDPPFPSSTVLAILRTTSTILVHCPNKHLYQSSEHLSLLLAAPDPVVVGASLTALMAVAKKPSQPNARFTGDEKLNERLNAMALGWGGKEQGLDLVACVSEETSAIQQGVQRTGNLQYSFFKTAQGGESSDGGAGETCRILIPAVHNKVESEHELLRKSVEDFSVPQSKRFTLLQKIRVAKRFNSLEGRRQLVCNRLMAINVFLQSVHNPEQITMFFMGEGELVSEIIALVEAEKAVPEPIRTLALKAIAVQVQDRPHRNAPTVVAGLSAGGQSGLLASLMQTAVGSMVNPGGQEGGVSAAFVEALFSVILGLANSIGGCNALASAGLIPNFLLMLGDTDPNHYPLVAMVGRILEAYMDLVPTASNLFHDLGGLKKATERLMREIEQGSKPISQGATPLELHPNSPHGNLPYQRRNLIKFLMRDIAVSCYSQQVTVRPDEADQDRFFKCLRLIMEQAREFGGQLFHQAAYTLTELIHFDPQVYPMVAKSGLPEAVMNSVKAGLVQAGEAIASVPNMLTAICLNTDGLNLVKNSNALDCLIPVLTQPSYIRALNGETLATLGTGLDEMMRHVHLLRSPVVAMLLKVVNTLVQMGGNPKGLPADSKQQDSAEAAPQPMETDADEGQSIAQTSATPSTSVNKAPEGQEHLGEMIQRTARVIESLLGNVEAGRLFVEQGGVGAMLLLYELPNLNTGFSSHSPLHAVTSALRILAQHHARAFAKQLAEALGNRLIVMEQEALKVQGSVQDLPEAQCEGYTRQLQMTEGLLSLAANVARMSPDLLEEICKGAADSLTVRVSKLERLIARQTTISQEWKTLQDAQKAAETKRQEQTPGTITLPVPQLPGASSSAPANRGTGNPAVVEPGVLLIDELMNEPPPEATLINGETADKEGKGKQRSIKDISYDALIHFASTSRVFYVQIAKMIHNPSRRREEVSGVPSLPMQTAAAVVSITMRDALTSVQELWPGLLDALTADPSVCRTRAVETTQLINYITHMCGGLGNTLFDARRRTCHSLILNYFCAGKGLPVLLQHLQLAIRLLGETNSINVQKLSLESKEPKALQEKLLKNAVEGGIRMLLQLLDHLVNADQLLSSPQAATLLVTPIPGQKAASKPGTAEDLVCSIQASISAAVMPLWTNADLGSMSPEVAQRIITILTKCTKGIDKAGTSGSGRAAVRTQVQPDPAIVQQIVEMGFSSARAENALRRLQHNNVDMALEWLLSNPEEPASPEPPSTAETPAVDIAKSFPSTDEAQPSSSSLQTAEAPGPAQLVEGAVNMLGKSPSTAFALSDLLSATCRQKEGENAQAVLQRLVFLLRGGPSGSPPSIAGRSEAALLASSHLLAVLTAENPSLATTAYEQGAATIALGLVEAWISSVGLPGNKPSHVPSWIDALLLILDQAIRVQPPSNVQAAKANSEKQGQQQGATTAKTYDEMQRIKAQQKVEQETLNDTAKAVEAGADPAVASLHATIKSLYSSGGLLSKEEQGRATSVCIKLVQALEHWAEKHHEKPKEAVSVQSSPASHARALLQLLARLTKDHTLAQQALDARVHHTILDLPGCAFQPEHAAHICAIMRHLLEDPATLQAAMEAEIRSALNQKTNRAGDHAGQTNLLLKSFLTQMATIIGRDPSIFFDALMATCYVHRVAGRPFVQLKPAQKPSAAKDKASGKPNEDTAKQEEPGPAAQINKDTPTMTTGQKPFRKRASMDMRTPRTKEDSKEAAAKSAMKGSRKAIPSNFVEIIDTLVDKLAGYKGVVLSAVQKPEGEAGETSAEGAAAAAAAPSSEAEPPNPQPASSAAGPSSNAKAGEEPAKEKQGLGPEEQAVLVQCICLKMLTDFTLMYTSAIGLVLRRDTESLAARNSPKARTPGRAGKQPGVLLRHILDVHLAHDPEPGVEMQALAQQSSHFLLAVSIRSAEGRRRIVNCIVDGLSNSPKQGQRGKGLRLPLYKVKALVELVTSLMCITPSKSAAATSGSKDHVQELIKEMVDAGVRKALLEVLRGLEFNHPQAASLINTILKPFETLTRSFLWRVKPSVPSEAQTGAESSTISNGASRPSDAAPQAGRQNGTRQGQRAEAEGEGNEVSEAGPEAVAAAQQAMQQYGQEDDENPPNARHLEEMMNAMIEQAYDEEMEDFDSEGSEDLDEEMEEEHDDEMEHGEMSEDDGDPMEDSEGSEEDDYDDDHSDDSSDDPEDDEGEMVVINHGDDAEVQAFIDAEDEALNEEERLLIDGPDFEDAIENAFQQGLEAAHAGVELAHGDEGEDGYEDREPWEEEEEDDEEDEDNEDFEDEEALEDAEEFVADLTAGQEFNMFIPHVHGQGGFGGIGGQPGLGGLQPPNQAILEQLFDTLGRVDRTLAGGMPFDPRRYNRLMSVAGQPSGRSRRPAQHALLQRPEATAPQQIGPPAVHRDAPMAYSTLMSHIGGQRRHHMSLLTDRHGYLFIHDRPGGRMSQLQHQSDPAELQVRNPILTSSIDLLMGTGGGSSNRGEARLANWSDDGLPPVGFSSEAPGLVAGTLENQLANVLSLNQPPAAPQEDQPTPAAEAQQPPEAQARDQPQEGTGAAAASAEPVSASEPTEPAQQAPQEMDIAAIMANNDPSALQQMAQNGNLPFSISLGNRQAPTDQAAQQPLQQPAEAGDQEMAEASPVVQPADGGDVPRAADIEMGPDGLEMDESFLEALPADLREEMMQAQANMARRSTASAQDRSERTTEDRATGMSGNAQSGGEAPADAAAEPVDPGSIAGATPGAAEGREEAEDMEGIDPEFIAALPPELQAEVIEQQRRDRRLREAAARQAAAQQQGAAAPAPDLDIATLLATFPPDVREEVLLTSDQTMLASLTPALLAEAQALRERAVRHRTGIGGIGQLTRSLLDREGDIGNELARGHLTARQAQLRSTLDNVMARAHDGDNLRSDEEEGPAPVEDKDVGVLVELMRVPVTMAKQMLQKVFTNLCCHHQTRQTILKLLMRLLYLSMVDPDTSSSNDTGESLPTNASKRFLDLLVHLARIKTRVAQELVPLPISTASTMEDPKGKGRAADAEVESPGVEIIFSLLSSQLCHRSTSHLLLALSLLELVLTAAKPPSMPPPSASRDLAAVPEEGEPARPSTSNGPQAAQDTNMQMEGEPSGNSADPTAASNMGRQGGDSSSEPRGTSNGGASSSKQTGQTPHTPDRRVQEAQAAVGKLPVAYLDELAHILGRAKLNDTASSKTASVTQLLVDCAPQHRGHLLSALQSQLHTCGKEAIKELTALATNSNPYGVKAGQAGQPVLRLLHIFTILTGRRPPSNSRQAPEPTPQVNPSEEQKAALRACAEQLQPLWEILSQCISKIEAGLGEQSTQQEQAHLLPPEAAQALPFVESYFVLCAARADQMPQAENLSRAASSELARMASYTLSTPVPATPSATADMPGTLMSLVGAEQVMALQSATSEQLPEQRKAWLEAHLPYLRFAEKHKRLLNALIRQNSHLLENNLAPLLRTPRLIDFDNKRGYFRSKVRMSNTERHYNSLRISVRRDHVFEDSFHQLRVRSPEEMRGKLTVHFQQEEGIDAGGLTREWYQVMAREMFNPNFSLFIPVPEGGTTFQPNPNSIVQNDEARNTNHLDFFKFVGRIVGKALYDGLFVDAYFTRSLYKHMLDMPLTYLDIEGVDPSYFKTLTWLLENDITDVLDLNFTEEVDYFGRKEVKELKPGGRDIKVTEANKREYINLKAQHYMTTAIRGQLDAFLGGFWDLIPKDMVKIFNDHELELLISGLPEIDIEDLRANTEYAGYTAASQTIQWFWKVVREMSKQELALLVQFVTGTSKVPLEGFKALQGTSGARKFQIHRAYGAQNRLPSAHTCFNQLDLIEYETLETLKHQLLTAIHEGSEGFGFG